MDFASLFDNVLSNDTARETVNPGEPVMIAHFSEDLLTLLDLQAYNVGVSDGPDSTFRQDGKDISRHFPQGGTFCRAENGMLFFIPTPSV